MQIWLGVRLFHVLCCTFCEVLMYLAVKEKFGRWEHTLLTGLKTSNYWFRKTRVAVCLDAALVGMMCCDFEFFAYSQQMRRFGWFAVWL